ncbi:MAG: alpha/beta hydrolase [Bacteroidota bacterium]|nr:alpha/beta hydrolase [Bacteroidota bacterium]
MFKDHIVHACRSLFIAFHVLACVSMSAQSSQIISSLVDVSRNNRVIDLDVRVPVGVTEPLPWVVFGHGFLMPTSDYDVLAETLNEAGMAMVMVDMETGILPSHEDFGLDLAYTVEHAAADALGLEGILGDKVALMGHSMGGGASWLAAAQLGTSVNALIGLAPAETTPSAMDAGSSILTPTLLISGSADAVTPPEEHHIPLHDAASPSTCRSFVNVLEGSHCGFADAGSLCYLGELLFSGMSRDEFQGHAFEMALLWLRAHLMEDASALNEMEAYGLAQSAVEVSLTCVLSEVPMLCESLKVWPNPAQETLFLSGLSPGDVLMAYDMHGRRLAVDWMRAGAIDIARWPRGMVVIQIQSKNGDVFHQKNILIH